VKHISLRNVVHVTLLTSKSWVAPIKKQTVPRHELCVALLLARLLHNVIDALNFEPSNNIFLWTDSVVLSWLQHCARCWKRFVGNRVAEIPSLTSVEHMTILLIMYPVALTEIL
jgi:hypothetical protein